ncbi:copper-binding protein [Bordetella sp. BOR01]|uniref:copper-binding protein n=1 Tax=Bordetella sp. BOR01 TaxID=2854779 RepID=UPI0021024787|nr:copper-binding protein [Bordetella sp. BOR01]
MAGRMCLGLAAFGMLAVWAAPLAQAQSANQEAAVSASASGEVRRVDAAAGKVTIRHGEISALDLPAMTLVYQADPALLAGIKPGDKVRFTAARQSGRYVVTEISK